MSCRKIFFQIIDIKKSDSYTEANVPKNKIN